MVWMPRFAGSEVWKRILAQRLRGSELEVSWRGPVLFNAEGGRGKISGFRGSEVQSEKAGFQGEVGEDGREGMRF